MQTLRSVIKNTAGGAIGNSIEWYDFSVFGFSAPITAQLFVSTGNSLSNILYVYLIFAIGFMARPLGSFIFGFIGDRYGRTVTLRITVWLMSIPTVLIGLMPTYEVLGLATPILIALFRFLQGLAMGGEFTGSIIYLSESAPPHRKGFFSSFGYLSTTAGILFGSAAIFLQHLLFTNQQILNGAWRIPFILAFLLGLVAFYLRKNLPEPKKVEKIVKEKLSGNPIIRAFRYNFDAILKSIGLNTFNAIGFYVFFIFINTYFTTILHIDADIALKLNTISLLILMLIMPLSGYISDLVTRKRVLLFSSFAFLILVFPAFLLFSQAHLVRTACIMLILTLLMGFVQGSLPATFVSLFPIENRASGLSISFNISNALFGGTAPLVALWLIEKSGNFRALSAYIVLSLIIFLYTVWRLPKKNQI